MRVRNPEDLPDAQNHFWRVGTPGAAPQRSSSVTPSLQETGSIALLPACVSYESPDFSLMQNDQGKSLPFDL